MTTPRIRLVLALAVVLAGAATTAACVHPRAPLPAPQVTATQTPASPTQTIHAPTFTVTFDVEPARAGTNVVNVYATTSDGRELTIQEWHLTATSSTEAQPITAGVVKLSGGHAVAQLDLPSAGVWRFAFRVRVSDTDEETVHADVRIS